MSLEIPGNKMFELIKETLRTPFSGLGKPEPPRHQLQGLWSPRVTQEYRLGYI